MSNNCPQNRTIQILNKSARYPLVEEQNANIRFSRDESATSEKAQERMLRS